MIILGKSTNKNVIYECSVGQFPVNGKERNQVNKRKPLPGVTCLYTLQGGTSKLVNQIDDFVASR
jgi:hypothetical protein